MLTNAYCTADEFRQFCRIDASTDNTLHESVVSAASRMVDRYTGRRRE